jgi:MinD superfamily P-loop ATPase
MRQLVILSGKGGTGKTSVAAALAHLASSEMPIVLADADVDAANLELVLEPAKLEEHAFMGGQVAVIDPDRCTGCGICAQVCRFEAVVVLQKNKGAEAQSRRGTEAQNRKGAREQGGLATMLPSDLAPPATLYRIDPLACEGCASCVTQCPEGAIHSEEQQAGLWFRSDTRFGPLFHAHLFAGQENSGKLVTMVKQQGRLLALDKGRKLLIVDGPPGIGCPVISASAGADLALLVTEPTISGVHDLERILGTVNHFRVPALVLVNKADVNLAHTAGIEAYCQAQGIELLGTLPYDDVVTEAMVHGQPVTAYQPQGAMALALRKAWTQMRERLDVSG